MNANMLPVSSDRNQGSDDQMTDKEIMEYLDRNEDMSRGDAPLSAEGEAEVEEYNCDQQSSSGEVGLCYRLTKKEIQLSCTNDGEGKGGDDSTGVECKNVPAVNGVEKVKWNIGS